MRAFAVHLSGLLLLSACSGPVGEADEKRLENDAAKIEAKADEAVNSTIKEIEADTTNDEGEGDEPVQKP